MEKGSVITAFDLKDSEYRRLRDMVYDNAGIHLGDNKKELVHARLSKVLRKRKIRGFKEYIKMVEEDSTGMELIELLDAIATNVTHFFRENAHFSFLKENLSNLVVNGQIRAWSAGCSSGEEPYSIAITFSEEQEKAGINRPYILATDISTKVLKRATQGVYPKKAVENLEMPMLKKYFLKGKGASEGTIKVKKNIIEMVDFQRLNLIEPFSIDTEFDVIFCRNVMIYFDNKTREMIVNKFYQSLRKDGYLIIGHSESLNGIKHPFQYVQPTIYHKRS